MDEWSDVRNNMRGGRVGGHVVQAGSIQGDVVIGDIGTADRHDRTHLRFLEAAEEAERAGMRLQTAVDRVKSRKVPPPPPHPGDRSDPVREADRAAKESLAALKQRLRRIELAGDPAVISVARLLVERAEAYVYLSRLGSEHEKPVRAGRHFHTSMDRFATAAGAAR
ncbi:hypothetical protein [Streptomyces sp. NPDC059080]|uniref:hypothetical protein n=1 Tax=Streptomyces sp. NPDC059080 TaxID=3346718 RepID=UPI0036859EA2